MKQVHLFFLFVMLVFTASAQDFKKTKKDSIIDTFNKDFIYNIKKAESTIKIDGIIDKHQGEASSLTFTCLTGAKIICQR